ncbi:MAG: DUF6220 domain-containing protein [Gemmatimonadota bacterium]|nr:DUF6220 domain-containing protein [Gemmatimonadota bacterium]
MSRWPMTVYLIGAVVFLIIVLVQVFLAGLVVVALQTDWSSHKTLGHYLALPAIIMLIAAYAGRFPGKLKLWTWLLFGLFILQAYILISLRAAVPVLSALHPVLALVEFALGLVLIGQARALDRSLPR